MRVLFLAVALLTALPQGPSLESAIVGDEVRLRLPANTCSAAAAAALVTKAAHIPAGVEYAPAACNRPATPPAPADGEVSFRGMTLSDALDMLVQFAPLYEWRNGGRVVVFRPASAWRDEKHFLNQRVENFTVRDGTLPTALAHLQTVLGPWDFGDGIPNATSEQMTREFSVSTGRVLLYEAMNAVIRSHGDASWVVRYCRPETRYEFSTIEFDTYDGKGIGGHAIFLTDKQGRRVDPCDPRALR